ncbi:Zn(2)-C6 fungal-type transcription factor [Pseudohyphozyma bogoriensis]|nr:Zn(2)-C6 fungal-type transcription factor [Pseudohyphozyma bogoriensis]
MAIRILYHLLSLDYLPTRVTTSLPPSEIDCALPGNYDDADLASLEMIEPKDMSISTDTTFERLKYLMAYEKRHLKELVVANAGLSYENVMDVDRAYRKLLIELPTDFRPDYVPPANEPVSLKWRRLSACQALHARISRLHRPFMTSGLRNKEHSYSTTSALDSAKQVLLAQRGLQGAPIIKCGFGLLIIQSAALILFMKLWNELLGYLLFPLRSIADDSLLHSPPKDDLDSALLEEAVAFFQLYGQLLARISRTVAKTAQGAAAEPTTNAATSVPLPPSNPFTDSFSIPNWDLSAGLYGIHVPLPTEAQTNLAFETQSPSDLLLSSSTFDLDNLFGSDFPSYQF